MSKSPITPAKRGVKSPGDIRVGKLRAIYGTKFAEGFGEKEKLTTVIERIGRATLGAKNKIRVGAKWGQQKSGQPANSTVRRSPRWLTPLSGLAQR